MPVLNRHQVCPWPGVMNLTESPDYPVYVAASDIMSVTFYRSENRTYTRFQTLKEAHDVQSTKQDFEFYVRAWSSERLIK